MENKYSMSIFWSEEDDSFIALSPDFPGLSAFGGSREDAAREAGEALAAMVDSLRDGKEVLPEPRLLPRHSGQLRIRIPKSLHTRLSLEAERQGVSLNTLIAGLLEQGQVRNEMLHPLRAEMEEIKDMVRDARSELAALKASQKKVEDAFSFAMNSGSTHVFKPLEVQASYTPVKQPMPRVVFRSKSCMSN